MQLASEKECAGFGYAMYFYGLLHCFLHYCAALETELNKPPKSNKNPKTFS